MKFLKKYGDIFFIVMVVFYFLDSGFGNQTVNILLGIAVTLMVINRSIGAILK